MIDEMSEKAPEDVPFPLCKNILCKKYQSSDYAFWKKDTELQYQFYLAALRAQNDSESLEKEYRAVQERAKAAEKENREMRSRIRLLEKEIYLMVQRNAHDSYVIDALHDLDFETEGVNHWESQIRQRVKLASSDADDEDRLCGMLKEEIELLKRKIGEDAELLHYFEPLEAKLLNIVDEVKLLTHQQSMRSKQELEEIHKEFQERAARIQELRSQESPEMAWVHEAFSAILGSDSKPVGDVLPSDENSVGSSVQTTQFDVSTEGSVAGEDREEKDNPQEQEISEFIAKKEMLDTKNLVNLHLINDSYLSLVECSKSLAEEYGSVFEAVAEVASLKEYLQRLNAHRTKRECAADVGAPDEAVRLDQLSLVLNTLVLEKDLLQSILEHFLENLKEDFKAHCVIVRNSEDA